MSRLFVKACQWLSLLTLSLWALRANADFRREENYLAAMQNTIEPWFAGGESGFFEGSPAATKAVKLFYRAFRQTEARADLVIVHGFGERTEKFAEIAYDFFQAGLNVYIYDQRGFGQSSRLLAKSQSVYVDHFASYAVDLKIFIDKIVHSDGGKRPLVVFSHSMGGAVSSLFAQIYPQLPKALILSAPMHEPQLLGVPHGLAEALATFFDFLGFGEKYAFGQKAPRQPIFEKAPTQSWTRWNYYANFLRRPEQVPQLSGGASFHWLREALRTTPSFVDPDFVGAIRARILLLQAAEDSFVSNEHQDRFCAIARLCTLVRIPMSKHEIYREKDQFRVPYLENILSFIDSEVGIDKSQ